MSYKFPAWSFSSLSAFETCPKQYFHVRVAKDVPNVQGEMAIYGERGHKALEERVRDGKPLSDEFAPLEPMVQKVLSKPYDDVFCERQYALTSGFKTTGWFDKDAWVRGVIDLELHLGSKAGLLDYKFGKRKPDSDQLKLFAGLVMSANPNIDQCSTGFLWLKDKRVDKETFTREDLPAIWQDFIPRVQRMERAYETDKWQKNPSGLCNGWCPVGAGNCEFWRAKRK